MTEWNLRILSSKQQVRTSPSPLFPHCLSLTFSSAILKRLGQNSQSLEYLEYLQDDPPRTEGITRTHVLALLTLTFEQSGSKYLVAVHETYQKLKESYLSDLRAGPNPEITVSKATRNFETKNIEISSEIWEILSLQMLEKCEIAFALEVFKQVWFSGSSSPLTQPLSLLPQATIKAPNKAPLQHSLAELYVLQNEKEKAIPHAEKAYQILVCDPQYL
jgi:tetratricopeptide (TPR) repeat protein